MKKILLSSLLIAALFVVLAVSHSSAMSGNFSFTSNLSVGSTDASSAGQVTILQNFLISKGYLTMPVGVSTGYFGNLTRGALASYQASAGISPAVGFFGPITRGNLNSLSVGATFSGTTNRNGSANNNGSTNTVSTNSNVYYFSNSTSTSSSTTSTSTFTTTTSSTTTVQSKPNSTSSCPSYASCGAQIGPTN